MVCFLAVKGSNCLELGNVENPVRFMPDNWGETFWLAMHEPAIASDKLMESFAVVGKLKTAIDFLLLVVKPINFLQLKVVLKVG